MDPNKLSSAIRLSIESALKSQETTVAEAVFVLETHKVSLVNMALKRAEQSAPAIQPATTVPTHPNGHHRG